MVRRIGTALAVSFLVALLFPAVPALAGSGGCHYDVTQGTGDTVELKDACFTPSILRVDPGDSVTFVNLDDFTHNVGGNQWGHFDDMNLNDAFTATFDETGVYPYACSYHPGMTGAIVVGSGEGAGNGEVVTIDSFAQPAASPVVEVRTVTEEASGAPVAIGWIVGGVVGLGLGFGVAALVRRGGQAAT
ncbi:MAG: plastocyanin/azurin family copper-binding protein [Actinomycetota bacterium]